MSARSSPVYRFGDLLALARQHWVRAMSEELSRAGFGDYRRSDAALVRLLMRGPQPVGRIGERLDVSRQAARKLVGGLERRGYARAATSATDARRLEVSLTARGEEFAHAIVTVIELLNRRMAERVGAAELLAADTVLRAVLPDERARNAAERLVPPPSL